MDNLFTLENSPERIVTIWPEGITLPDPITKSWLAVYGAKFVRQQRL